MDRLHNILPMLCTLTFLKPQILTIVYDSYLKTAIVAAAFEVRIVTLDNKSQKNESEDIVLYSCITSRPKHPPPQTLNLPDFLDCLKIGYLPYNSVKFTNFVTLQLLAIKCWFMHLLLNVTMLSLGPSRLIDNFVSALTLLASAFHNM